MRGMSGVPLPPLHATLFRPREDGGPVNVRAIHGEMLDVIPRLVAEGAE